MAVPFLSDWKSAKRQKHRGASNFMRLYFIIPLFLQKLIWIPTRFILIFFGRLEVRGLENLNGIRTNVIFASNHPSELDPFLIPTSLPFWSHFSPMFYATREKAFYNTVGWRRHFFGGLFIRLWGGYQVIAGLRDYKKALPHHIRIVRDGGNLCIFPEGGRTAGGTHPAKGGVAYLAELTNRPIVPVGISGVHGMTVLDFFFRRRKIIVRFGEGIELKYLKSNKIPSVAEGNFYKEAASYVMQQTTAGLT